MEPGRAVMRKLRCPPRWTSMPPEEEDPSWEKYGWARVPMLVFVPVEMMLEAVERMEMMSAWVVESSMVGSGCQLVHWGGMPVLGHAGD